MSFHFVTFVTRSLTSKNMVNLHKDMHVLWPDLAFLHSCCRLCNSNLISNHQMVYITNRLRMFLAVIRYFFPSILVWFLRWEGKYSYGELCSHWISLSSISQVQVDHSGDEHYQHQWENPNIYPSRV